jgi:hypothetical protein
MCYLNLTIEQFLKKSVLCGRIFFTLYFCYVLKIFLRYIENNIKRLKKGEKLNKIYRTLILEVKILFGCCQTISSGKKQTP